jgi:FtsP/CotA-like multicopper oxidase with cupredoxin domain
MPIGFSVASSSKAVRKFSRRELLKWGIVAGGAAMFGLRSSRLAAADGGTDTGPTTKPFVWELLPGRGLPYLSRPVLPFTTQPDPGYCVNVDGTSSYHVSGPRNVPSETEFHLVHTRPVWHQFHPALPHHLLWGYNGQIPGPTIVSRSGTPQLVRFVNDLPEDDPVGIGLPILAVHRHGGFQAPEDDGYPLDTFCSGQSRDYFFPNHPALGLAQNEHSTLWYHDHAIDITAQNVYRGLAGLNPNFDSLDSGNELDPNPAALRLPSGEFDVALVLQDRLFDANGYLLYDSFDHNGFLGNKFLVNGLIQPFLRVARRKYRFRIMNGSNARFYDLVLNNGQLFTVVGTDANLLEHPVSVRSLRLGPAERMDVIVNFAGTALGQRIHLVNRMEQTDGRKPGDLVSPGIPLLQFLVSRDAVDPSRVPEDLRLLTEGPQDLLPRVRVHRRFKAERTNGAWAINGEFFDENRINATPRVGVPEVWTFEAGGGWTHPVHLHLSEVFVVGRGGSRVPLLERGRKDTVNVGASYGDASLLVKFDGYTGRYAFHCHTIEHEDMRMMGQFEVQS